LGRSKRRSKALKRLVIFINFINKNNKQASLLKKLIEGFYSAEATNFEAKGLVKISFSPPILKRVANCI